MEQYEMTYHLIGTAPYNSRGGSVHDTQTRAEWASLEHAIKHKENYAYRITRCVEVEGEGWHRVSSTHILNLRKVSEEAWIKAVKGRS
jgi:hypothetical protein